MYLLITVVMQVFGSETAKDDNSNRDIPTKPVKQQEDITEENNVVEKENTDDDDDVEPLELSSPIVPSYIPELLSKSNLITDEFLSEVCYCINRPLRSCCKSVCSIALPPCS